MEELLVLAYESLLRTKPLLKAASACAQLCEELGIGPLASDLRQNVRELTILALRAPHATTTLSTLLSEGGASAKLHLFWLHRDLATVVCYVRRRRNHGDASADALTHAYDLWLAPVHTGAMRAAFRMARAAIAPADADIDRAIASHAQLDMETIERALERVAQLVPTAD